MSLSLARTWVNATILHPAARAKALDLLDAAASNSLEGTMIVGPRLSTSGRCYVCRWDATELVVRELTGEQQQNWSVNPAGLFEKLQPTEMLAYMNPQKMPVSLTEVQIEGEQPHDGWTPLCGTCVVESLTDDYVPDFALQAIYFRPDLPRSVTHMWFSNRHLYRSRKTLHFQFLPLFSDKNPQTYRGPVIVFLQLCTATDWAKKIGCGRVSNVADIEITIR